VVIEFFYVDRQTDRQTDTSNLKILSLLIFKAFKDEAQTALFKDPVRTAL